MKSRVRDDIQSWPNAQAARVPVSASRRESLRFPCPFPQNHSGPTSPPGGRVRPRRTGSPSWAAFALPASRTPESSSLLAPGACLVALPPRLDSTSPGRLTENLSTPSAPRPSLWASGRQPRTTPRRHRPDPAPPIRH
eukprot:3345418-Rhodomonas_salina.1